MQEMWVQSLGQGDPLEGGHGNPMDRGACQARVQGVAKSQTRLKRLSTTQPLFSVITLKQKKTPD